MSSKNNFKLKSCYKRKIKLAVTVCIFFILLFCFFFFETLKQHKDIQDYIVFLGYVSLMGLSGSILYKLTRIIYVVDDKAIYYVDNKNNNILLIVPWEGIDKIQYNQKILMQNAAIDKSKPVNTITIPPVYKHSCIHMLLLNAKLTQNYIIDIKGTKIPLFPIENYESFEQILYKNMNIKIS